MPRSNPNRLIEWYLLFKDEWLPAQHRHLADWWEAVKQEPQLAWATPAVRYGVYSAGALIVVLIVASAIESFTPPPPADAQPRATTATFHVVCSNPDCRQQFMIERKFGFSKFPVQCPTCQGKTGQRGLRCSSAQCRGKYVATRVEKGRLICTECGQSLGRAP
ncbi:MAG: hypothetical protein ACE5GE_04770 [Phycisphaerae bacterium]